MAEIQQGNVYKILNSSSGTVLDLSDRDNQYVVGYTDSGTLSQEWFVESLSSTNVVLKNVGTNTYLSHGGGDHPKNATLVVASGQRCKWTANFDKTDGTYQLLVPDTNMALDLCNHSDPVPGTNVQLWGGSSHRWKFVQVLVTGTVYKLLNKTSQTYLDNSTGDTVTVATDTGADHQHWILVTTGTGWVFRNVQTHKFLAPDGEESSFKDGTKVICRDKLFNWRLQRVSGHVHRLTVPKTNLCVWFSNGAVKLKYGDSDVGLLWDFIYVSSHSLKEEIYRLINTETGKILVEKDSDKKVFVGELTDDNHQKWKLKVDTDGYSLQNGATSNYLAIADDTAENHTEVVTTAEKYFWQIRSNGADNLPSVHRLYVPTESFVVTVKKDGTNAVELYEKQDGQQSSWRFEDRNDDGKLTLDEEWCPEL